MVSQIYPTKFELNKVNSFDTVATFLNLDLSITNCIVSFKIYGKRDNFNFERVMISHFLKEMFLAQIAMVYIFYTLV